MRTFSFRAGIGLADDFGRVYAVNNHTQAALDAAALAAGRVSQLEKVDTVVTASAAADAYFATAKPSNVVKSSLEFSPNALKPRDSEAGAPAVCQANFLCLRQGRDHRHGRPLPRPSTSGATSRS